jgi:hypothetical protein
MKDARGDRFFSPYIAGTQCSTGNGNIQWATHTTFCVAKHFFHRFSHRDTFNSIYSLGLFFFLSWNWSTSETSKTSFFLCYIYTKWDFGGKNHTKNTYIRIQKVWLEFGCSKMERVQHQLWANEYDRFDHYRCGRSPSILQQSIVLLALRKKCTTTTNVQNFTSIEQKIRLFLKYFCWQISKKKKLNVGREIGKNWNSHRVKRTTHANIEKSWGEGRDHRDFCIAHLCCV